MIEDELIKIWQASSSQERIKFDTSKLMIELESSLGRLHRWWKYLELIEFISIGIGMFSFAFILYWVPFTTSKIASGLIILFLINILIQLFRIKKLKPTDLEENYLEYLKKTREYLEAQRRLLATSVYWVILPIFPIMFLFLVGFWEIPEKRLVISLTYVATIAMGIYGYFLNKKRVKKEINPRIDSVDELIKELAD